MTIVSPEKHVSPLAGNLKTSSSTATAAATPTIDPLITPEVTEASGLFPKNGPDPSARSWGHNPDGKTFAAQKKLPKQPLPSLDSSCRRYLAALRPLQSDEEHAASIAAVDRFQRGVGPLLQAQLQAYDQSHDNWFEHFCYEAFLSDDSPVVLNSNAFASFPRPPKGINLWERTNICRAASLVQSTLEFANSIREDRLPVEEMRGVPQCMYQYWWLFGTARVPGADGGRLRMDPDARHIIVMHDDHIYRVNVLEEETYKIVPRTEIIRALAWIEEAGIRNYSQKNPSKYGDDLACTEESYRNERHRSEIHEEAHYPIGVLTTENQKVWYRCRKELENASVQNGRNLTAIDTALFVLCLDSTRPTKKSEICRNMVCGTSQMATARPKVNADGAPGKTSELGTCGNRWYDKLSIIVCDNVESGMNFEHTCTDGSVDIRLACEVYQGSLRFETTREDCMARCLKGADGLRNYERPSNVKKMEWEVPKSTAKAIRGAEVRLLERVRKHHTAVLEFKDYGKSYITSAGFSPDAYFQMALHAAYYSVVTSTNEFPTISYSSEEEDEEPSCTNGNGNSHDRANQSNHSTNNNDTNNPSHGLANGFEPVLMRQYLHGRTDVARTQTPESVSWIRTFHSPSSTATPTSRQQKITALRKATEAHVSNFKECARGNSHHRHLYVLHQMYKRRSAMLQLNGIADPFASANNPTSVSSAEVEDKDTIFTDPGWSRLGRTELMASNVDNPSIAFAGFGPPSDEGFTVVYYIRGDHLALSVTARNGKQGKMVEAIEKVLREMRELVEGS